MDRREFLRLAGYSAVVPFAWAGTPSVRPNVVLVLSDDQDLRSLSGMPKTLARFAPGLTFANAFVTSPLCSPSRVSIMTGRRVPTHGIEVNDNAAPNFRRKGYGRDSLGWWLKTEAGYATSYVGKVMNGYERIPAWELPGYDNFVGTLANRNPIRWNRNGTVRKTSIARKNETKALGDNTVGFVRDAVEPFFAFASIKAPHVPLDPSDKNKGAYGGVPLPQRPNFDHRDPNKPAFVRNEAPFTAQEKSEMAAHYRGRMEELLDLDDQVEAIFAALEARGVLDNTYVVFTSDNGLLEGEHRLRSKAHPYEESVRVPLLVRGPGMRENATSDLMAANTDVAPTILELAGLDPAEHGCDGRSLVGPMFDETIPPEEWRRSLALECRDSRNNAADWRAVRTANAVYVERSNGETEYYDLANDPYQLTSLHNDPDGGAAEAAALSELLADLEGRGGEELRAAEVS